MKTNLIFLLLIIFSSCKKQVNITDWEGAPLEWVVKEGNSYIISISSPFDHSVQIFKQSNKPIKKRNLNKNLKDFETWAFYKGVNTTGKVEYKSKINISKTITPGDGIIEGYIVHEFDSLFIKAFIFVDDDWYNEMDSTNILWGTLLSKQKQFNYQKLFDGLFVDTVFIDQRAFANNGLLRFEKIVVGDVNIETMRDENAKPTFMICQ
jgi:hypothetical protein